MSAQLRRRPHRRALRLTAPVCLSLLVTPAVAGPPYVTDDPDPVEYRHWEVYRASLLSRGAGEWSGTAPHVEVNYGGGPEPAAPHHPAHVLRSLDRGNDDARLRRYGAWREVSARAGNFSPSAGPARFALCVGDEARQIPATRLGLGRQPPMDVLTTDLRRTFLDAECAGHGATTHVSGLIPGAVEL
jgi:hypothetical protein